LTKFFNKVFDKLSYLGKKYYFILIKKSKFKFVNSIFRNFVNFVKKKLSIGNFPSFKVGRMIWKIPICLKYHLFISVSLERASET